MKKRKNAVSLLLIFSFALAFACPAHTVLVLPTELQAASLPETANTNAPNTPLSGTCGESITWELEEVPMEDASDKTWYHLSLTGEGSMDQSLFWDIHTETVIISPWMDYRKGILSLTIGEGITSICDYAFLGLSSLTSLELPDSIISIGNSAFRETASLTSVTCGAGLKRIGNNAFFNASSLSSVHLPEGLEELGSYAFSGCTRLSGISLPESLAAIGHSAFFPSGLTSITIPRNVSSILPSAFSGTPLEEIHVQDGSQYYQAQNNVLYGLREDGTPQKAIAYAVSAPANTVTLAEGTETIGAYTFSKAKNLTSLGLPSTLTEIGLGAFSRCSSLNSLRLPNQLQTIGEDAFWGCKSLQEISIPDSVTTVGNRAFSFCDALTAIHIGNLCTSRIEWGNALQNSKSIRTVTVAPENPYLTSIDNVLYDKAHTTLYYYAPMKPDDTYWVLAPVTAISSHAIGQVPSIEKLYLPSTLAKLCPYSIFANQNLDSIYFSGNAPNGAQAKEVIDNCAEDLLLYRTASSTGWGSDAHWLSHPLSFWDPVADLLETGPFWKPSPSGKPIPSRKQPLLK